jgi:hypothetical protein
VRQQKKKRCVGKRKKKAVTKKKRHMRMEKLFFTGRVKRGVGGDMLHIALPAQMKNKKNYKKRFPPPRQNLGMGEGGWENNLPDRG